MEDKNREDGWDELGAPEEGNGADAAAPVAAEAEAEAEAEAGPEAEGEAEERPASHWYVVHTYSGYENKVRQNLLHRVESMAAGDLIFDVVVPTEEVVELHQGQRRTVERRIFPGYVLVNMILNDHSWTVVRNTPGVTGFVGSGKDPTPLLEDEVAKIMQRMEAGAPRVRVSFQPGSKVRITDGPFADFIGTVDTIDNDRRKVRVMVNFFGRDTPIELDFLQVEEI
ncbi:MAG: transcription termination/antitermination protein NusG [Anaerolineae bacterium]|nr:transcription termination/antitermination protein NusG [Anaerolineae bacterium]